MAILPGRHQAPIPYEQPHDPAPAHPVAGERVRHPDGGPGWGHVVRAMDRDGLVEVDFGRHGTTVLAAADLERPGR